MKHSDKRPSILKETSIERKERLRYSSSMFTKVVPNKKKRTRAQQKRSDRREGEVYVDEN